VFLGMKVCGGALKVVGARLRDQHQFDRRDLGRTTGARQLDPPGFIRTNGLELYVDGGYIAR
jgi:hypothetical protein